MSVTDKLSTTGVWFFTDMLTTEQSRETAARIESLGYSALWIPDTLGRDPFVNAAILLDATSELIVATGIANIHMRHPGMMKQGAQSLAEFSDGRFVLGLGVSHAPMVEGLRQLPYEKPLSTMRAYLDAMDGSMYMSVPPAEEPLVVLAALGPKMLAMSAEKTAGAHPYWTTPQHTAQAREIMGPDALLCVEQKCVLTTDADAAHEATRDQLGMYADLPNYRNNWKRLGFSEDEIESRDPRFLDAVMAWGDEAAIAARIQAHYDAGASHVCIQPVNPQDRSQPDWTLLEALAPSAQ
ncbi:MAG: TIGR03620 family F420-dependent LLM class oxidoreductase [Acidimicrobiales bacterium]|jgi:probable F420-dependent oxidoreductase|nr:TIGR03620 family F420-dependent LLM class oxidoreductase [Acidimicrobiales bacterium]